MSKATMRFPLAVVIGLMFSIMVPAHAQLVKIDAALGTPVMLAGERATTFLRVALTGEDIKDESKRAPLNVSIVIDKSGSMQGEKMEAAKRAAKAAVERLRKDDIVSIIAYDTTVSIVQPAIQIGDVKTTQPILAAIDLVNAGGSTALFAGVSMGAGELRKDLGSGRVNRLVLLSDGLANIGPSSPGELAELGISLGREGINVTTLGLGLDYNEDLMSRLASSSDGNHMFIDSVNDLERAYAMEFGDAMTVVARDASVIIRCEDGVRPVRSLGRDAIINGQAARIDIGQIGSQRTKYCLLEVELPAGADGGSAEVASVDVSYVEMKSQEKANRNQSVKVRYSSSKDEVKRSTNTAVMVAAVQQIAADRNVLAMRLRDSGKIEEARQELLSNRAYLYENFSRYDDEQLKRDADTNGFAAENLDPEQWKYNRKLQQEYQVGIKKQGVILEKGR
ncbi:MAG TPA: VWA domain-containing protein [Candidatus Hydrogenedentes bacterium]|nr:VWA domain-containing protein [Candidatus Hydrogenedentota bacterium]